MGELIRVELDGSLADRYVMVDPDEMDVGFFEDLESQRFKLILDALGRVIKGGDLPGGIDRAGLRRLKPADMQSLIQGVSRAWQVSKSRTQGVY